MKSTLLLAGAHRGGESFSRAGAPALRNRIREVLVADPVADRAITLANFWRNAGLVAQAKAQPAETVVKRLWPEGVAFVAIDKPAAIAKVVALGCMIPVRWQILARGSSADAPVLGFAGTILPSDESLRTQSVALLGRLATVIPDQTSRAVWGGSVFNQDALATMRRSVSEQSVQEIVSLEERYPTEGSLELFCGTDVFPLRVERMRYEPPEYEALAASICALNTVIDSELDGCVAVAVLPSAKGRPRSMHLFVVEGGWQGARVRLHQEFGSAAAAALTD